MKPITFQGQDGQPLTLADKMKMLGIDHDETKNENRSESTQILSMKQNASGDGGMQNTTQYSDGKSRGFHIDPSLLQKMQRGMLLKGTEGEHRDEEKYARENGLFAFETDIYNPGEFEEPDHSGKTETQIARYRKNSAFLNRVRPAHLRPKRGTQTYSMLFFKKPEFNPKYGQTQNNRYSENKRRIHAIKIQVEKDQKNAERLAEEQMAQAQKNEGAIKQHEEELAKKFKMFKAEKGDVFDQLEKAKEKDEIKQSVEAVKMATMLIDRDFENPLVNQSGQKTRSYGGSESSSKSGSKSNDSHEQKSKSYSGQSNGKIYDSAKPKSSLDSAYVSRGSSKANDSGIVADGKYENEIFEKSSKTKSYDSGAYVSSAYTPAYNQTRKSYNSKPSSSSSTSNGESKTKSYDSKPQKAWIPSIPGWN